MDTVDTKVTRKRADALVVSWAGDQLARGVDAKLVVFCAILALGDLLVEEETILPDLQEIHESSQGYSS